jgi:membrane protein DedA with SNARE-associated domain/rhodanese-related sulfurtransferase
MDLHQLSQVLRQDAITVVFFNVLLQQAGLPVPAVPTLLLAGSLAATPVHLLQLVAAAIVASVVADWVWYHVGRLFGYRVLAGLCRLSINPGSCVSQTEARFVRWGLPSLVVAKFIPGFSTVAPPIAGALRMSLPGFLSAAAAGGALWAGLARAPAGLNDAVCMIRCSTAHTTTALVVVPALAGAWLGWKLWQRHRFKATQSALSHITPGELMAALRSEQPPLLIDLRGARMVAETGPLPGTMAELDHLDEVVGAWPKDRLIVTLCACPEDAGAVAAARRLMTAGYRSVKPLRGGYDAWMAAPGSAPPPLG